MKMYNKNLVKSTDRKKSTQKDFIAARAYPQRHTIRKHARNMRGMNFKCVSIQLEACMSL